MRLKLDHLRKLWIKKFHLISGAQGTINTLSQLQND